MKAKRLIALVLAGVMLMATALSGCGKTEVIDKEATVMTIDGTEVSLGFVNFVARFEQALRDPYYVSYMGEGVWSADTDGNGQTLEDDTKAEIMEMIQSWYVLEAKQDEYGVKVSDEMMKNIEETATQFLADNTEAAIAQMGATQEYVEKMLYYTVLESLMQEAIEAEATITTTDDIVMRTFSYIMLAGYGANNDEGVYELYSDEMLAKVKETAQASADRAKTDFDTVAKELGYEGSTYSYNEDDVTTDPNLIEAADSLKVGEVSGMIEGTNGYYVVRLDSENDEAAAAKKMASMVAAERVEYYEGVVAELIEAADIQLDEKLWKQVKFDTLFSVPEEDDAAAEDDGSAVTE